MSRQLALPRYETFPSVAAIAVPKTAARAGAPLDRPGVLLLLGAIVTLPLIAVDAADRTGAGIAAEDLHVLVSMLAGTGAMLMLARRPGIHMLRYDLLAFCLFISGVGQLVLDLQPVVGTAAASIVANTAFSIAAVLGVAAIIPALYRRLDRRKAISAGLDGGIILVSGVTILVAIWRAGQDSPLEPAALVLPVLATILFASAGIAIVAALAMRIAPTPSGIWAGILGVLIEGACWSMWIDRFLHSQPRDALVAGMYSLGILLVGYAWMTWHEEVSTKRGYARFAVALGDWLPMAGILACVALQAFPHGRVYGLDPAPIGCAIVIALTIARQRLLLLSERLASRNLAREVQERAETTMSLARLKPADSLQASAGRICDEALRLDGIGAAAVYSFSANGRVVPLALQGECRRGDIVGEAIDEERAAHMRACASQGPWIDSITAASGQVNRLHGEAFTPMRWNDQIVGVVAMGALSARETLRLPERRPTFAEFGVVSAALLGPALAEEGQLQGVRNRLEEVIANHAFTPVFQPVVRLEDRSVVGYEALTRFADGTRPDVRFIEAHKLGMSAKLETVCLGDQLEAASWLPEGTWVSLNVSPALATAIVPLVSALERAERDIVLEITEHVVIADYDKLVGALEMVRPRVKLAVDDAGAGYAGLRHILELRPQFVKLDLSLVRNIDTDRARQAMVAGMAHFAHDSGCELIAEGIETEAERLELVRLGVGLGQGYLFGRPGIVG
jgi:EAL domain-containing protein (putative c-di-GMP-specific phosphodiesterase class I)